MNGTIFNTVKTQQREKERKQNEPIKLMELLSSKQTNTQTPIISQLKKESIPLTYQEHVNAQFLKTVSYISGEINSYLDKNSDTPNTSDALKPFTIHVTYQIHKDDTYSSIKGKDTILGFDSAFFLAKSIISLLNKTSYNLKVDVKSFNNNSDKTQVNFDIIVQGSN